jgi:hypothetical protein
MNACSLLVYLFMFGCFWQAEADPSRNLDFEEYIPSTVAVPGWSFENRHHSPLTA